MKKLITFIMVFALAIFANAEDATFDINANDVVYIEGVLQTGVEGNLSIMLKNSSKSVGTITYVFSMPEGISFNVNAEGDVEDIVTDGSFVCHQQPDGSFKLAINYGKTWGVSTTARSIASIPVNCTASVGEHEIEATSAQVIFADNTGVDFANFSTTITVQKTAVIEPLDANNDIEIIPFEFTGGGNFDEPINAAILMKSESYVKSLEFDFELPAGISVPSIEEDGDVIYAEPELENNKGAVSAEITMNEDGTYHYSLSGTSTKYIYPADEMTQFSTLPLMSENPVADGVYTIKIYNISMTTKNDEFEGGNYYASVIVGKPAQEEAILYGHFTSDAASTFTTALKNVAIADVTAATVDDGAKFTDVLVNEKGGNSYYTRTSEYYGTTVLPLDLTTENVDKLYKIESMDANSIVLTETENVAANTPCIFKGTINVEGATPTLGVPSEQGLGQTTFKGTYSATSIEEGDGYYISSDGYFYNDGASIRPFRGYFEGAIAGVKSFGVKLSTADGLIDITDQLSDEAIYSLQGIRMNNAQKGVNIKGGKKVYVK